MGSASAYALFACLPSTRTAIQTVQPPKPVPPVGHTPVSETPEGCTDGTRTMRPISTLLHLLRILRPYSRHWSIVDRVSQDQRLDELFAPIGPIMYLIGCSKELAQFFESGQIPDDVQDADELLQSWQFLLSDLEQLTPNLMRWIDLTVERSLDRWPVDFLARIGKIRWRIRSTEGGPDQSTQLHEFVQYLQDRVADLRAMVTAEGVAAQPISQESEPDEELSDVAPKYVFADALVCDERQFGNGGRYMGILKRLSRAQWRARLNMLSSRNRERVLVRLEEWHQKRSRKRS